MNVSWTQIVGKMTDVDSSELGEVLTLFADELSPDIITVDCRTCVTQLEMLALMAERFGFPSCFGMNLDALYDVVTERLTTHEKVPNPQVWLLKTGFSQQKMLFPIKDTLSDAMSESQDARISILWWVFDY